MITKERRKDADGFWDGYNVLENGKRIATISKGWTRLNGNGWVIISGDTRLNRIGSSHKNLASAMRSIEYNIHKALKTVTTN
jgi:hypothetical protein